MRKLLQFILISTFICNSVACSSNSSDEASEKADAYEMMHVAFEGSPEIEEFKPMMEAVMERYNMERTDDNANRVGSALVSLRKDSKAGVTEMDILKHIYQKGSSTGTFADQAGLSATYLEKNK